MNEGAERSFKEKHNEQRLDTAEFVNAIHAAGMTYEPSPYDLTAETGAIDENILADLPPHLSRYVRSIADTCRAYLSYPIITDSFEKHGERRAWRDDMVHRYGTGFERLYEQNRIKGNALYALYSWFHDMAHHLERRKQTSARVQQLYETLAALPDISRYDELSTEEKRAVVEKMDSIALAFLHLVTLRNA